MVWRVSADEFDISLGVLRNDEVIRDVVHIGQVFGHLRLRYDVDVDDRRLPDEAAMSAGDLRLLAAAALAVAEQIEELQRQAVVTP